MNTFIRSRSSGRTLTTALAIVFLIMLGWMILTVINDTTNDVETVAMLRDGAPCADLTAGVEPGESFVAKIRKTCWTAILDTRGKAGPGLTREAKSYLDSVATFAAALSELGQTPSNAGAFLIARETGTLDALIRWARFHDTRTRQSATATNL